MICSVIYMHADNMQLLREAGTRSRSLCENSSRCSLRICALVCIYKVLPSRDLKTTSVLVSPLWKDNLLSSTSSGGRGWPSLPRQQLRTEEQRVPIGVPTSFFWVPAPLVVWGWGEERGGTSPQGSGRRGRSRSLAASTAGVTPGLRACPSYRGSLPGPLPVHWHSAPSPPVPCQRSALGHPELPPHVMASLRGHILVHPESRKREQGWASFSPRHCPLPAGQAQRTGPEVAPADFQLDREVPSSPAFRGPLSKLVFLLEPLPLAFERGGKGRASRREPERPKTHGNPFAPRNETSLPVLAEIVPNSKVL